MLIAHASAGYIVTKSFNKIKKDNISYLKYGLIFSILPDLDLLYFYLIDNKNTLHHFYFPHIPAFLLLGCLLIPVLKQLKITSKIINIYSLFLINWFVHLVLDTITGGINWLFPFSERLFFLIQIPAKYPHWILSFIFHWSFLIEIGIIIWSIILFLKGNRTYPLK